ncbi:MAG: hypothetical protein KGM47_14765 [Acidobacteriota bacterium]|nr:hypothetical protein [Acidobacteriota bacterium]
MPAQLNNKSQPDISTGEEQGQLEKILHSAVFRSSPGLQKFLEYVVSKTINGLSHEIKEYAIAVEVLGKSSEYDPRLDTAVRAQAHRLREKLEEYYAGEGAADFLRIELPKGHYIPQFTRQNQVIAEPRNGHGENHQSETTESLRLPLSDSPLHSEFPNSNRRPSRNTLIWLSLGAAGALLFIAGMLLSPWLRSRSSVASNPGFQAFAAASRKLPPPLRAIWGDFWNGSSSPLVAYSNSIFLVTQTSDLLRLNTGSVDGLGAPADGREAAKLAANPRLVRDAGPVFFDDDHTGTGEVMAVYYLTRLFSQANLPLTVERSRLIKAGDLRSHNVIFIGSVVENPILDGIPLDQNFVFSQPEKAPTLWRNRIVNLHPQPGEPPFYAIERDKQTQVLRTDYAVISFLPGVSAGHEIVILAGLTTIGTQAAAQFVTSPAGAQDILTRLGAKGDHLQSTKSPHFFQAVLRVDMQQDEILSIHCVAARAIHPTRQNY